MRSLPTKYSKARYQSDLLEGYWAVLYLLIYDDGVLASFDSSVIYDNLEMARECECIPIVHEIKVLVEPKRFPYVFKAIQDKESEQRSDRLAVLPEGLLK